MSQNRSRQFSVYAASVLPSGEKATCLTGVPKSSLSLAFQESALATATVPPSSTHASRPSFGDQTAGAEGSKVINTRLSGALRTTLRSPKPYLSTAMTEQSGDQEIERTLPS